MKKKLTRMKKMIFRFFAYFLLSRVAWQDDEIGGRKVVVVGSAPVSLPPVDYDESYLVMSVNASQIVAKRWGRIKPDISLMMFNQIEGTNTNAREVRRVLNGERTGKLYVLTWKHGVPRLIKGLAEFNYQYDSLEIISRNRRVDLVKKMTGKLNFEVSDEQKYSNGVIGVMLALRSGAKRVIISGINPASAGHIYNSENLHRKHKGPDMDALRHMQKLGLPVYTADPEVAKATGLPLWTGEA